jgi:long-chain acyl-CoA synthetase
MADQTHAWDWDEIPTLIDALEKSCLLYADKPVYSCLGQTVTYGQLWAYVEAFTAYLQHESGLQQGDRIAIQLPNLIQYPIAVFSALRAGLVVVNTNPLYTPRELEHQFNDSGAKALIVLGDLLPVVEQVMPLTGVERVIVAQWTDLNSPQPLPDTGIGQIISMVDALSAGKQLSVFPVKIAPQDTAVLQYTGGTTGPSKGAIISHRNLVAYIYMTREFWGDAVAVCGETVIVPLPIYHVYGFTVSLLSLIERGNHAVLISNPRDIPGFVAELGRHKFTLFMGINTLFTALCNDESFRKLDFSALKATLSGGMTLNTQTSQQWQRVTGCRVAEGYGMSETTSIIASNPLDAIQVGTVGVPLPSTLVKVLDEQGRELGVGESGELCVSGPQVTTGYWGRPELSAQEFTDDGFLRTGDIVCIQDDGYIKVVDRKKDMIIVSGFNVYPNEVEDVVMSHPDIVECAAVAVPDEASGEAIKLFAVVRTELNEEILREFCREHLTRYKVPKFVEFRDDLPKSNVGKILRRELRG